MASQTQEKAEAPAALLADHLDPSSVQQQTQSSLFIILPPEIRNRIFSLALRSYDDKAKPYEKGTFWDRPDTSHHLILDTRLLLTCRRIYLETCILPCFQTERLYWWGRGPTTELTCRNPVEDLKRMTPALRSRAAIHIFVQQFQLEGAVKRIFTEKLFRPASLKLTLRHTDWWNWEESAPLCLDPKQNGKPHRSRYVAPDKPFGNSSWGVCLAYINDLQTFVLELETVVTKKHELDDIVRRARDWVFPMHDGAFLTCDSNSKKVTTWKSIDRFYELGRESYRPEARKGDAPELTYYVVELTWRRTKRDPAKDRLGEEWSTTTYRGVALPPLPPPVVERESLGLFD